MILLKVTAAKNAWFATIGFLIMDSSFKITYVMVVILSVNTIDIAIIMVKNVDYRCIIHNTINSAAIDLLQNSVLEDCGYI